MKYLYVFILRALRGLLAQVRVLMFLESRRHNAVCFYLRSLFAIYDAEDMAHLDVPWWTFSATTYVEAFLQKHNGNAQVFEYGPGASTVWLSKRAGHITYVEHDQKFARTVAQLLQGKENISGAVISAVTCSNELISCPSGRTGYEGFDFSDYVMAIRNARGPFDLIVIDGRARVSCLTEAVNHLKPGGIILFDNSRRARYRESIEKSALRKIRFRGFAPALPYLEETMIMSSEGVERT